MVCNPPQVVEQVYVMRAWWAEIDTLSSFDLRSTHLAWFFVGYSGLELGLGLELCCHSSSSSVPR